MGDADTKGGRAVRKVDRDALVEEMLTASRALVGIAVRSIAAAPVEVTVAQHRLLVLLASRGPQTVGDIADLLGVNPSNASRHCDRLQRLGLVDRRRSDDDGRVVRIELTREGRDLLEAVTQRRRQDISDLVRRLPREDGPALVAALRALNTAAGEISAEDWPDLDLH